MRPLRALWMRLSHGRRSAQDIEAELESHVRLHTDEGIRAGLSEQEARRQALIRLGGAEQARQAYRERATLPAIEIGVRMALGADRVDILRLILREALRLVIAGGGAGLAAALAVSRVLKSLLFHVGPYDPASYVIVALLLGAVALAATVIPACSATRTDPMAALRVD